MLSPRTFVAALCAVLPLTHLLVSAAPVAQSSTSATGSSTYWYGQKSVHTHGTVWGNSDNYTVYRNVMDYGAVGDGNADDTEAINKAITDGTRCGGTPDGPFCDSSTITPALVFFPPGTYKISKPIVQYYYTQMVGDALELPTIVAAPEFAGIAMIDSDPYNNTGGNWYTNQNNFFRQIRNFNLDLTPMGPTKGAGIHWQVAQATSLQNIVFNMVEDPDTQQQGIFMDNGSGGFMGDLTFNGGKFGAFLGNQQFTSRNLVFNNCQTAIFMNWNWGWTFSNVTINNCTTGLDMANSPSNQTVGSVILIDSKMTGVKVGVNSSFSMTGSIPVTGGTLYLENVDMTDTTVAVQSNNGTPILPRGHIDAWASGRGYTGASGSRVQGNVPSHPSKPASLKAANGAVFTRSKPQYENVPAANITGAKATGMCAGDGETDDTACVQNFLNSIQPGGVAYFEHGAYLISDTIKVPNTIKITGEIWPLIVATNTKGNFGDQSNPKPVFLVGDGDSGAVEMSDLVFETKGSTPGAIMIQWNLNSTQGESGMWDVHVRLGGSYGTDLQIDTCAKNPAQGSANASCEASFLMFHATAKSGGVYLENTWFWTADHDLDMGQPGQISIYNGRGALFESQGGPVWLWGTASEHSVLYNYQFIGVTALFSGFMQSETPYFQPDPVAPAPFQFNNEYDDPLFTVCPTGGNNATGAPCKDAWGLRVWKSTGVFIYGTGLYSFFNDYDQTCVGEENCQENMVHIQDSTVTMFGVSTKAAVNMILQDGVVQALDKDNRSNFCATIAYYFTS